MEFKEAQEAIRLAILRDAEKVIASAIEFAPERKVADLVREVRAVPGPVEGVAAAAIKAALTGKTPQESRDSIILFASLMLL